MNKKKIVQKVNGNFIFCAFGVSMASWISKMEQEEEKARKREREGVKEQKKDDELFCKRKLLLTEIEMD